MSNSLRSWGLQPASHPGAARPIHWRDQAARLVSAPGPVRLAYGNGRSYGDVCLNNGGDLIPTTGLERVIAYDPAAGIITAEAGVTFAQILRLVVPDGWFTPVTPGTSWLTLGGALANDVHGKEHRAQGTFGRHVTAFVLWRSDQGRLECSRETNGDLFRATIGGLGLTGLITQATFQLQAIAGPCLAAENRLGDCVEGMWSVHPGEPYQVAWLDASARGSDLGRGVISRGNFVDGQTEPPRRAFAIPPFLPSSLINNAFFNALNKMRWQAAAWGPKQERVSWSRFFHPLDRLAGWNRGTARADFSNIRA